MDYVVNDRGTEYFEIKNGKKISRITIEDLENQIRSIKKKN